MPAPNITNEQRVRPISEFTNNQLLNIIRNNAAPEYQKRIPAATQSSIHDVMNGIMSSTSLKNEFYNQLVNVIGQQYVNTWRKNNWCSAKNTFYSNQSKRFIIRSQDSVICSIVSLRHV